MDLVRIDSVDSGVVYMRASALFSLASATTPNGNTDLKRVNARFIAEGGGMTELLIAGEVDEVAAMFESIRGWDIYRLV